jgi:hypothetical protein
MRCIDDDSLLEEAVDQALKSEERPIWLLWNLRSKTRPLIRVVRKQAEFTARTSTRSHTAIALGGPPKKRSEKDDRP